LTVYYVNATILAKPNTVQLLQSADIITNNIHVAFVAETWFDCKVNDDLISVDNYTLVRLDRNPVQKHKGGGVCCYVRKLMMLSLMFSSSVTQLNLALNICGFVVRMVQRIT